MADLASLVVRFTAETSRYNSGLRDISQRTNKLEADVRSAGERIQRSVSAIPKAIAGALAGIGTANLAKSILEQADRYQLLQGRLKIVTSSSEELASVNAKLFAVAQRTRQPLEAVAELYTRVAQNAKDLGLTQQQLIDFTETVSQSFQISGASTAEAAGAIRQLTQALASGVFRGEEFNSVAEQGPRILQALTDSLGVTRGQLRDMAKDGKLTADTVIRALAQQSGAIRKEFEQLPTTLGQSLEQVKNELFKAFGGLDTSNLVAAIDEVREGLSSPTNASGLLVPIQALTDGLADLIRLGNEFGDTAITAAALGASVALGRYGASATAAATATAKAVYATEQQVAVNAVAEATWAKLTAAQVEETSATIADTRATIAAVEAARVEQVAILQLANAKAAQAAATLQNIEATLAEGAVVQRTLQASLGAAQATRARSAALKELALLGQQQARLEAQLTAQTAAFSAAQLRAAEAETARAAAMARTGIAARAAAAGTSLMNGALALVGGPVGLAITAAAALAYFISSMESAEDRAKRLSNRLRELSGDFSGLSREADIKELEETQKRIAKLDTEIAQMQGILIDAARFGGVNHEMSESLNQLADERAKLLQIESALEDRINGVTPAIDKAAEATTNLGAATASASAEVEKQLVQMRAVQALLEKGYSLDEARTRAKLMEAGATEAQVAEYLKLEHALDAAAEAAKKTKKAHDEYAASLESAKDIQEEVERMQQEQNKAIEEAKRLYDETRTPIEKYRAELEKLEMLRARFDSGLPGGISDEVYKRSLGNIEKQFNDAQNTAKKTTDAMSVYAERAAQNMQDAFAEFLFDPFKDGLDGMLADFADILQRMAAQAAAAQIFESLGFGGGGGGLLGSLGGLAGSAIGSFFGGGATDGAVDFANQDPFGPVQYRASGGDVNAGQMYMVGEQGPEMFVSDTAGRIVANDDLFGGRNDITINVPIYSATGSVDPRTRYQVAQDVARETNRVMGRS